MTILSVIQEACKAVGLDVPDAVASATDRRYVEMLSVANEMAERIAGGADWQALSTIGTFTGDGSATEFDLPSNYDRMPAKAQMWSSSLSAPLSHIEGLDRWLGLDVQSFDFVVHAWTIYGGKVHIKPALATGVTAKFFYISNGFVVPASGANKSAFTADEDTFILDERLLKLGIIWRWKERKGLDYAESMADYEEALQRRVAKDKGSSVLRLGRVRLPSDVRIAYPVPIE